MLDQILYHIKLQVIPIHKMFNALEEDRSKDLLMFHSLTGCDTTTGMLGITKHTAFQKWLDIVAKDSSIRAAMNNIICHDLTAINLDDNQQKGVIERFISRIHHAGCDNKDDARLQLLLHKSVALQKLPMTSHTFENKLRRSMYQSYIWTQSLKKTYFTRLFLFI